MICFIYGTEPYLKDAEKRKFIGESCVDVAYYQEWNEEAAAAAFIQPLFSETEKRKIVLELSTLKNDEGLKDYVKKPSPVCDLLILAGEVNKTLGIFKELSRKAEVKVCNKVDNTLLKKFIGRELVKEDAKITTDAYNLLVERSGYRNDPDCTLYTLRTYCKQLSLLSSEITEDVVKEVVPETIDEKMFAISNYLFSKEGQKMYELAINLLKQKENPIAMLSAVMRVFRLAYKASLYPDKKGKELDKVIGVPAFQYAKAAGYPPALLKECLEEIQATVNGIKTGYDSKKAFIICLGSLYQKLSQ